MTGKLILKSLIFTLPWKRYNPADRKWIVCGCEFYQSSWSTGVTTRTFILSCWLCCSVSVFVEGTHVSGEMLDQAAGFLFNFVFCCTYRLQRWAASVHVAGCGGATCPGAGESDWGCWDCAAASRTGCPNGLAVGTTQKRRREHTTNEKEKKTATHHNRDVRKTEKQREERIVGRRWKRRVSKKSTKFHRVEKWKKKERRNEVRRWGGGGGRKWRERRERLVWFKHTACRQHAVRQKGKADGDFLWTRKCRNNSNQKTENSLWDLWTSLWLL